MTERQKTLIASLKNEPAFVALLEHLDEEVAGMLSSLEVAETVQDIMRLARLWQVAVRLVSRLRTAPEVMSEAIAKEQDKPTLELNPWGMVEEDPFLKHTRPVPPPYQETQ